MRHLVSDNVLVQFLPTKGDRCRQREPKVLRSTEKTFMVVRKLVSVAFVIVMLAALGFAQGAATGDLHITVRDPKGGVVTNATVTARDETKGLERATSENSDGQYQHPAAASGTLYGQRRSRRVSARPP